jgi:hypothetical protein
LFSTKKEKNNDAVEDVECEEITKNKTYFHTSALVNIEKKIKAKIAG